MKRSHDDRHDSPPIEYLIPRCGTVHRVRIHDRYELRLFRTELELLRRIADAARFRAPARPVGYLKTLTAETYLELDQILHDASHPLIVTTIARIDRDFTDLRKDIVMPVVDEEAKKIVAEAAEAGMDLTSEPDRNDAADVVDAISVGEALDVAQAGLAAAVAGNSTEPSEDTTPPASVSSAPPTHAEDAVAPGEPEQTGTTEVESTAVEEDNADASIEPVETPGIGDVDDSFVQASSTTQDDGIGADHVENAVAVIEQGIRKLATLLKGEIQEQWTRAHDTLEEVDSSRAKIDEERQSTQEMLEEITRLRDEARIARDEAELARREAKQEREAARVAKERAETSAAVAELAADQAAREAKASLDADPPEGDG